MSRFIISTTITVDGVMEVGEWYVAEGQHDRAAQELFEQSAALVLGRKNYEGLAAYWSPLTGEWADLINPLPKFVASRTLQEPLEWNSTLLEGDVSAEVTRLKDELEGDLLSFGYGELTRYLVTAGVVDELRYWIHPVLWGRGERMSVGDEGARLEMLDSTTFDSGVTLLRYRPLAAA